MADQKFPRKKLAKQPNNRIKQKIQNCVINVPSFHYAKLPLITSEQSLSFSRHQLFMRLPVLKSNSFCRPSKQCRLHAITPRVRRGGQRLGEFTAIFPISAEHNIRMCRTGIQLAEVTLTRSQSKALYKVLAYRRRLVISSIIVLL